MTTANKVPQPELVEAEYAEQVTALAVEEEFDLRPVLRRWELLRLLYNGVLVLIVISATLYASPSYFAEEPFWELLIVGALAANGCYLLGPIVEMYLKWLGIWHISLTIITFAAGTIATAGAAVFCVFKYPHFPLIL